MHHLPFYKEAIVNEPTLKETTRILNQKVKPVEGERRLYYFEGQYPLLLAQRLRAFDANGYNTLYTVPNIVDGALLGIYFVTEHEVNRVLCE